MEGMHIQGRSREDGSKLQGRKWYPALKGRKGWREREGRRRGEERRERTKV